MLTQKLAPRRLPPGSLNSLERTFSPFWFTPHAPPRMRPLLSTHFSTRCTPIRSWPIFARTQHFQFIYEHLERVLPAQQLESGWLDVKADRARKEVTGFFGGGAPGDAINGNVVLMVYVPNGRSIRADHWNSITSHEYVYVAQRSVFN